MMDRWGLEGMKSFRQVSVAEKEQRRLELEAASTESPRSEPLQSAA